MKILRIPNRYSKQISRLKDSERLFIFDSLMKLSCGQNVIIPDTMTGDILELVWRDCVQMEKKNGNFDENTVGNCVVSNPPSKLAGYSAPEVKGKERKGSEVKRNEMKISLKEITAKAEKNFFGNEEINKVLKLLEESVGLDQFKETQKMQRRYGLHFFSLLEKIGKDKFQERLELILANDFKQKNCNSLEYLYGEMKSFIHSPKVKTKSKKEQSTSYH